jgi:glycosyltransferase involved in cell wall biosynthesis
MTILLVGQHYPPGNTTTAKYLAVIAEEVAREDWVLVITGTPGSGSNVVSDRIRVVEIPMRESPRDAFVRRGWAMFSFGLRASVRVFRNAKGSDIVITVTTPFLLPYFVVLAAWLRGARTALIVYDVYPDVLVRAGLSKEQSLVVRIIRVMNGVLYRRLDEVVTIGREMGKYLASYAGGRLDKIVYIPNWTTLTPALRAIDPENPYRKSLRGKVIVGLSGTLGFTHDPVTVFDAAKLLLDVPHVHFLLSGWGTGWEKLKTLQDNATLPNVTLVERVPEVSRETLLTAADLCIIPYRKNMAGLSVPSRLYDLLAIGRPIILLSEHDSEAAHLLTDADAGWIVPAENPAALAETIRSAASHPADIMDKGLRGPAIVARQFTRGISGAKYRELVRRLRRHSEPALEEVR